MTPLGLTTWTLSVLPSTAPARAMRVACVDPDGAAIDDAQVTFSHTLDFELPRR